MANNTIKPYNNYFYIQKVGNVTIKGHLQYHLKDIKIMSYTVSKIADKYYLSVNYEVSNNLLHKQKLDLGIIGIDVGLKSFSTESNGSKVYSPMPLKTHLKRLKHYQRIVSRSKKGSCQRYKKRKKLSKIYARIANIRKDFLHKYSRKIINNNFIIALEDLSIKSMVQNHKLARSINDSSWNEFNQMIKYKAKQTGSIVLHCNTFYPSSKTCSQCGYKKEHLGLDEREFICEQCGSVLDRDRNASINILGECLKQIIPGATGKFTSAEIVSMVHRAIGELKTIDEAILKPNGRWNTEFILNSMRNQVQAAIAA